VGGFLSSTLGFFLTWWGVIILAFLDSSLLFFVPLGIDAVLVYLAAAHPERFWVYPLLTTAGSTASAAVTYWLGRKLGNVGLERFVPPRRLERFKARVGNAGAIAMALPAALPPPFPLTAFVLTCGALEVDARRFFFVYVGARLLRFGVEAALARRYGQGVLRVLQSATFEWIVGGFVIVAVAGTVVSAAALWRKTRKADETKQAQVR
jgi:membrane protein YqaA with SNARE-associated domain